MAFGLLALVGAAIFAGVALYVNVVAQPARLSLDDRALLIEWKPSYRRGAAMQAPLALVGCLLGLIAWWHTPHPGFLIGAVAIIAPVPWTLVVIKPVNDTFAPHWAHSQPPLFCGHVYRARRGPRICGHVSVP